MFWGAASTRTQHPFPWPGCWIESFLSSGLQGGQPRQPPTGHGQGAIAQGGENPTFVSGKERFIKKQAEANWKGKLAML